MKNLLLVAFATLALPLYAADQKSADGFITIFDGKNLEGWKAGENPGTFKLQDGTLVTDGERAHLFYVGDVKGHDFKNFHLRAQIMTSPNSNSGIYFHTAFQESGWLSKGFEVQVNNTHQDPKKTAGLYGIKDNFTAPVEDGKWFTMEIIVEGNTSSPKWTARSSPTGRRKATPHRRKLLGA
jgi:hypothetical protein